MANVWIVRGWWNYDPDDCVLGVWTSEVKADEQVQKVSSGSVYDGVNMEKVELDTELEGF